MPSLAATVDDYLENPPVALEDPVDAITGISASSAEQYADPDATPTSYFGRDAVVETVGDLVCSTGTVEAAPAQYQDDARYDVLAAAADPDTIAEYAADASPADFDPGSLTATDVDFQRFVTACGALVSLHGRLAEPPTIAAIHEDDARAGSGTEPMQVARPGHAPTLDDSAFVTAEATSDRLEMHQWDVALITTAESVAALAGPDVRESTTTVRVAVDTLLTASLLVRRNLARNPEGVRVVDAEDAPRAEFVPRAQDGGVTLLVDGPDGEYTLAAATRGRSDDGLVARLVDEQVV